jgi:hypothetical protein
MHRCYGPTSSLVAATACSNQLQYKHLTCCINLKHLTDLLIWLSKTRPNGPPAIQKDNYVPQGRGGELTAGSPATLGRAPCIGGRPTGGKSHCRGRPTPGKTDRRSRPTLGREGSMRGAVPLLGGLIAVGRPTLGRARSIWRPSFFREGSLQGPSAPL